MVEIQKIKKRMLRNLLKNCLTLMILTVGITVLNTSAVFYFCLTNSQIV